MAAAEDVEADLNLLSRAMNDAQARIAAAAERFERSYAQLRWRVAEQHALLAARYGPELNEPAHRLLRRAFAEAVKTAEDTVDALNNEALGIAYGADVIQKAQDQMDLDARALVDAERAAAAPAAARPQMQQRSPPRRVWALADLAPLDIDELAQWRFDLEPVESPPAHHALPPRGPD